MQAVGYDSVRLPAENKSQWLTGPAEQTVVMPKPNASALVYAKHRALSYDMHPVSTLH